MFQKLHYQVLNLINFFSPIYIAIVFFLIKKIETVSDIFIVVSFVTIFTQGFSANMRNIYLGSRIFLEFKLVVLIRILIGIFALLRFWGKLVLIKKAKQSERKNHRNTYSEAESKEANKRVGKTTLHLFKNKSKQKPKYNIDAEDIDFKEIK